jgi:hypothetical protein
MKLHFESDLPYQAAAIEAVCDLFRGQEVCRSEFTVTMQALSTRPLVPELESGELFPGTVPQQLTLEGVQETDQGGIGNRLTLLDDEIADNLVSIQVRNGLPPSGKLSADFTVEMETGTGKTYVYLRTVFELNRRYGFTKFVVVVPSVAIKEGVNKTLEITREHFEALYPSAKGYEFFQYDSAKLGQVRNYATSPNIQIMVITVGAINKFGDETEAAVEESDESKRREKSKNVMYRAREKTGGEKPIDLVRATKPIIIVDEPQSVDGGIDGRGKKALDRMDPLCTFRYSATHAEKHNMTVSHITGVTSRSEKDVYMFEADDKAGYKRCMSDDLAINTLWAWMGAMGVSPLAGIVSPDYHVYTSKGELLTNYVDLLCRSRPFVAEVSRWSKGVWSSRLRLYPENFLEIRLPVPPHEEQFEIVRAVETDQRKASALRDNLQLSIALAKERRATLITATVTGQIPLEEMTG